MNREGTFFTSLSKYTLGMKCLCRLKRKEGSSEGKNDGCLTLIPDLHRHHHDHLTERQEQAEGQVLDGCRRKQETTMTDKLRPVGVSEAICYSFAEAPSHPAVSHLRRHSALTLAVRD